jgi:hypothetical protein
MPVDCAIFSKESRAVPGAPEALNRVPELPKAQQSLG